MRNLEKIVREALNANKCKIGAKGVLGSIKGSKLIVVTKSMPLTKKSRIIGEANSNSVPVFEYAGNSTALGRVCNKPFRISVISLKLGSQEEIHNILNSYTALDRQLT
jgi:large subunit ribosomal protein L30e